MSFGDGSAQRRLLRIWIIVCLLPLASCAGPPRPRTTFLRSVDLVEMTEWMAESMSSDPLIAARERGDDRWVISIARVTNHTNQIIREGEKWAYIARLRALLAQTDFSEVHSIIWVIPPEHWPQISEGTGLPADPYGSRMDPTHQLTAEFHALTVTSATGRSDTYVCNYQLYDLQTGAIIWEDTWEVKRAVEGLTFD